MLLVTSNNLENLLENAQTEVLSVSEWTRIHLFDTHEPNLHAKTGARILVKSHHTLMCLYWNSIGFA